MMRSFLFCIYPTPYFIKLNQLLAWLTQCKQLGIQDDMLGFLGDRLRLAKKLGVTSSPKT